MIENVIGHNSCIQYQPTEWITEKFPEEKVQIDVKFVQKECMSP